MQSDANHGDLTDVFVTVGTTKFDTLIRCLCSANICQILKRKGCKQLTLQIGNGLYVPAEKTVAGVKLNVFKYKPSLHDNMKNADLIISHAGAGSVMESLSEGKRLLVVINEELMDNHQYELALQLHKDGHLLYCTCSTLEEVLENIDKPVIQPFVRGNTQKFASFLDNVMGLS